MKDVPTITLIRKGKLYRSLDVQDIPKLGTDEIAARVTFANSGLIRRDMLDFSEARAALKKFKAADLLKMAQEAGECFLNDTLPVGEEQIPQTPEDYVQSLSATSGLPHSLIRMNMERLNGVFQQVPTIFKGL